MKLKSLFLMMILTLTSTFTMAAEHTVKMLNTGADGIMIFEPGLLRVAVGDTVHFEPTDVGHNSESIQGFVPEGGTTWKGALGKKVSVTFDKEGVYVYQCLPHAALAMIGVVVVGNPTNLDDIKAKSSELVSKFATNKDRLSKYLAQIK